MVWKRYNNNHPLLPLHITLAAIPHTNDRLHCSCLFLNTTHRSGGVRQQKEGERIPSPHLHWRRMLLWVPYFPYKWMSENRKRKKNLWVTSHDYACAVVSCINHNWIYTSRWQMNFGIDFWCRSTRDLIKWWGRRSGWRGRSVISLRQSVICWLRIIYCIM